MRCRTTCEHKQTHTHLAAGQFRVLCLQLHTHYSVEGRFHCRSLQIQWHGVRVHLLRFADTIRHDFANVAHTDSVLFDASLFLRVDDLLWWWIVVCFVLCCARACVCVCVCVCQ